MANINVNELIDLNLAGADLFNDPESFMKDLNEESEQVIGGLRCEDLTCLKTRVQCGWGTRGDIIINFAEPVKALQELSEFTLKP